MELPGGAEGEVGGGGCAASRLSQLGSSSSTHSRQRGILSCAVAAVAATRAGVPHADIAGLNCSKIECPGGLLASSCSIVDF